MLLWKPAADDSATRGRGDGVPVISTSTPSLRQPYDASHQAQASYVAGSPVPLPLPPGPPVRLDSGRNCLLVSYL